MIEKTIKMIFLTKEKKLQWVELNLTSCEDKKHVPTRDKARRAVIREGNSHRRDENKILELSWVIVGKTCSVNILNVVHVSWHISRIIERIWRQRLLCSLLSKKTTLALIRNYSEINYFRDDNNDVIVVIVFCTRNENSKMCRKARFFKINSLNKFDKMYFKSFYENFSVSQTWHSLVTVEYRTKRIKWMPICASRWISIRSTCIVKLLPSPIYVNSLFYIRSMM